jgi:hypothetical protein
MNCLCPSNLSLWKRNALLLPFRPPFRAGSGLRLRRCPCEREGEFMSILESFVRQQLELGGTSWRHRGTNISCEGS